MWCLQDVGMPLMVAQHVMIPIASGQLRYAAGETVLREQICVHPAFRETRASDEHLLCANTPVHPASAFQDWLRPGLPLLLVFLS